MAASLNSAFDRFWRRLIFPSTVDFNRLPRHSVKLCQRALFDLHDSIKTCVRKCCVPYHGDGEATSFLPWRWHGIACSWAWCPKTSSVRRPDVEPTTARKRTLQRETGHVRQSRVYARTCQIKTFIPSVCWSHISFLKSFLNQFISVTFQSIFVEFKSDASWVN